MNEEDDEKAGEKKTNKNLERGRDRTIKAVLPKNWRKCDLCLYTVNQEDRCRI